MLFPSVQTLLIRPQEEHPICKKNDWWHAGVLICLQQGASGLEAHANPTPSSLASLKSTMV